MQWCDLKEYTIHTGAYIEPLQENGQITVEETVQQEQEISQDETGTAKEPLVWVKVSNLFWPAKLKSRDIGELKEIEMFDDNCTRKAVDAGKIKPFEQLEKIPAKRSVLWKESLGLLELNIWNQFAIIYYFLQ